MRNLFCLIFILLPLWGGAQTFSGFVLDESNNPVPYANVYFKGTQLGTTTDIYGEFYYQFREPGFYEVVVTAVGYQSQSLEVQLNEGEEINRTIYLKQDVTQIEQAVIKAKRKDPAIGIIQEAIKNKERWNEQYTTSTCNVYIKASEVISERERKKRARQVEREKIQEQEERDKEDVFEREERMRQEKIDSISSGMNMVEVELIRHTALPNKVKEVRNAYRSWGDSYGLFFTTTAEVSFNFYDNLMNIDNLNELPLVSPLHITSILTYKFNLVETTFEGSKAIYKIKVTPRKKGNASWEGFIWIQEGEFCIKKVDLWLEKGGLYVYDEFRVKQEYSFLSDSIIVMDEQEFLYESKSGLRDFKGRTIAVYSDYEINPEFDKKMFRNEVAVTTQEAMDRDSTYWEMHRPIPLSQEEQRFQFVKDSIHQVETSKTYLDSLDRVTNKVTALDVLWFGIDHTNRSDKRYWYVNPVGAMFNPLSIGGWRIGQGGAYFKRWENEKYFAGSAYASYGIRNEDVKGNFALSYLHDPFTQGQLTFIGARRFNVIAMNDAITNLLQRENWIDEISGELIYERELFNGLYATPYVKYKERRPISGYALNPDADDFFEDNNPRDFDIYQAVSASIELEYTPFQKYMREPHRKVVLGSKWPTFGVYLEKGIPGVYGSDVNYSFVSGWVRQNFKLGTMGTSSYHVKGGKFLAADQLRYEDYKIFPRGDRYLFATMMSSMQLQDSTLTTQDYYLQAHYVHHFNGAIINYIPMVKKLGIQVSGGVSGLWLKENNYTYGEVFLGVERGFKIQRHRYRVGLFFVAARSSGDELTPRLKLAINQYNVRDKSWGNN